MSVRKLVFLVTCCVAMILNSQNAAAQDNPDNPVVIIETSLAEPGVAGAILVELDQANAPISVENFLQYIESGHYSGTTFHRVIKGFMIQGGGFTPDMTQKPTRPPIKNEARNGLSNERGTLAMGRTNIVDSATAQFFINTVNNNALNNSGVTPDAYGYAVFGKVIDFAGSMDIVDKIEGVATGTRGRFTDVPDTAVEILSIYVDPDTRFGRAWCQPTERSRACQSASMPAGTPEQEQTSSTTLEDLVETLGGELDRNQGIVSSVSLGFTEVTDTHLAYLTELTALERLSLYGTQISDAGLAHLTELTALEDISLDGTRITDAGLTHLTGLAALENLSLDETEISDAGLAHFTGLTGLKYLNLSDTQITDAGLAHLTELTALETLYLDGTKITDAGLARLTGLTALKVLLLNRNWITGAGLTHLTALTELERLDLRFAPTTDAGLAHLSGLTKLVTLDLRGTQVTDAGVAELQKALPNCKIRRQ